MIKIIREMMRNLTAVSGRNQSVFNNTNENNYDNEDDYNDDDDKSDDKQHIFDMPLPAHFTRLPCFPHTLQLIVNDLQKSAAI